MYYLGMWHADTLKNLKNQPVPEDYYVVISDIRGSTVAIRAGHQRVVNMLGASCIAAVRNHFLPGEIAYVFGGDGASFVVPSKHLSLLIKLLSSVQALAKRAF